MKLTIALALLLPPATGTQPNTQSPSDAPSTSPSEIPSASPSLEPSDSPSTSPSDGPSDVPTEAPVLQQKHRPLQRKHRSLGPAILLRQLQVTRHRMTPHRCQVLSHPRVQRQGLLRARRQQRPGVQRRPKYAQLSNRFRTMLQPPQPNVVLRPVPNPQSRRAASHPVIPPSHARKSKTTQTAKRVLPTLSTAVQTA